MSNQYQSLENALELAACRLPPNLLGILITQAEGVIETNGEATTLERKIHSMVNEFVTGNPLFNLKKLKADNDAGTPAETSQVA